MDDAAMDDAAMDDAAMDGQSIQGSHQDTFKDRKRRHISHRRCLLMLLLQSKAKKAATKAAKAKAAAKAKKNVAAAAALSAQRTGGQEPGVAAAAALSALRTRGQEPDVAAAAALSALRTRGQEPDVAAAAALSAQRTRGQEPGWQEPQPQLSDGVPCPCCAPTLLPTTIGVGRKAVVQMAVVAGQLFAVKRQLLPLGQALGLPENAGHELHVLHSLRVHAHPNVVRLETFFVTEHPGRGVELGLLFQLACTDLRKFLDAQGLADALLATGLARDLLHGLAHLHDHLIVHRDLVPSNLLLNHVARADCDTRRGRATSSAQPEESRCRCPCISPCISSSPCIRQQQHPPPKQKNKMPPLCRPTLLITDFGNCTSPSLPARLPSPQLRHGLGQNYTAPEVWLGQRNRGSAEDIWSAGVIAAEMVGQHMFPAERTRSSALRWQLQTLGVPTEEDWLGCQFLPGWNEFVLPHLQFPRLPNAWLDGHDVVCSSEGLGSSLSSIRLRLLVRRTVVFPPRHRPSAMQALRLLQPALVPLPALPRRMRQKTAPPADGAPAVQAPPRAPSPQRAANMGVGPCQCKGNCNNRACWSAKARLARDRPGRRQRAGKIEQACSTVPLAHGLCSECTCSQSGCWKPRYRDKWCKFHTRFWAGQSEALLAVLAVAELLPEMRPADIRAWESHVAPCKPDMAVQLLAFLLKEPHAVKAFMAAVGLLGPTYTAVGLVGAVAEAIKCGARAMTPWTRANLFSGRSSSCFGPARVGVALRLLKPPGGAVGSRNPRPAPAHSRAGQGGESLLEDAHLTRGSMQRSIKKVCHNNAVVEGLLRACRLACLPELPVIMERTPVLAYFDGVTCALGQVPAGLGFSEASCYVRPAFLLKVLLLVVGAASPEGLVCFKQWCTVQQLSQWAPDLGKHLECLPQMWSLEELERHYRVPAWDLAMWACSWSGALNSASGQHFRGLLRCAATSEAGSKGGAVLIQRLQASILALKAQHPDIPPSPFMLLQHAAQMAAGRQGRGESSRDTEPFAFPCAAA